MSRAPPKSPKRRREQSGRVAPASSPAAPLSVRNPFLEGFEDYGEGPQALPMALLSSNMNQEYFINFEPLQEIGRGSFGTVMRCLKRIDGQVYAVKCLTRPIQSLQVLREVLALAALDDTTHIVRYYTAWVEQDHLYIQMELMDYSLDRLLDTPLSEATLRHILHDCLLGLNEIHSHDMVHLDIKPANLFHRNGRYKIGDLGLARPLSCPSKGVEEGDGRYLPTELLRDETRFLQQADVFSLGASVYELARGIRLPKSGDEWTSLRSGTLPPLPNVSPKLLALLARMMHPDPSRRPLARVLLKDAMFSRGATPAEDMYRTLAGVYRERWLAAERMRGCLPPLTTATPSSGSPTSSALTPAEADPFVLPPLVRRTLLGPGVPPAPSSAHTAGRTHPRSDSCCVSGVMKPTPPTGPPLGRRPHMMRVGRCLSVPELSLVNQLENDLLAAYGGLDSLCIVDEEGSSSVSECHDVMLTATDLRRDDILDGDDDDIVLAPQFSPSSAPHQDEPVRDAAPTRAEDWSSNSFGLALPFLPPPSAMLEPSPTSPDEPALQKPRKSSVFDLSIGVVDASNPLAFTSVQPPSLLPPRTPSRRPHVHPPRTPSRHRPMSFLLSTGGSVGTPAVSASPSPAGPTLNISTEGPQDASPSRTYSRLLFCMDGMPPTVDTSTPTLVSPPTSSSHSPFVFNISPIARTGASLLPTHTALNFSNVSSVAMSPP